MMLTLNHKNIPQKVLLTVLLSSSLVAFAYAQNQPERVNGDLPSRTMPALAEQARAYRSQGFQLQTAGDTENALKYYQKAVEIDPLYAAAYNDVGVIYEAKGDISRAEENYLKAVQIDPNFISGYSNLAFLYEGKRDLKKAEYCWDKRAKLGQEGDPWTQKAIQRLRDIHVILGGHGYREQEIIDYMGEISQRKSLLRENDREFAKDIFSKAKRSYAKKDYPAAFAQAINAQQFDPDNAEIEAFIVKIQRRALSR
ncbi:MAG: tetratricopeptide repeat protein [Candidatus Omnitrophota bacterium]|jgi:tetratricopeptide (TPR) repeat protein